MIRITAPDGKKLRDTRNDRLHAEIICEDKLATYFVVADSPDDPTIESLDGVTLGERVNDLEDAVIELAEIISEVV